MFYAISRFVVGLYYRTFYRVEVIGQKNIPKNGGFIVCSNHMSVKDPMVLGVFIKRPLSFIGKKEIFKKKFFSLVLKGLHVIPIDRENADMATFKTVIAQLKNGAGIGIFAQGTRVKELDLKSAKAGVALFALKADVPIIPVCISSNYKHFSKVYVNIGEPFFLNQYKGAKIKTEGLNEITETVMLAISKLKIEDL
ncbi:MAG: 1-acyl-sn-glycerol-3-phosphate acyltransferase [Clostridiales bacterium]|jgi:1-acyl-sn-glycerol-3-phosphate acyltransferase|nr:1-acyl-sn-glycerol-3-phosphate acyltransferase [Clostridiales bacterium]